MDFPTRPFSQHLTSNRGLVLTKGRGLRVERNVDCFGDAETEVFEGERHGSGRLIAKIVGDLLDRIYSGIFGTPNCSGPFLEGEVGDARLACDHIKRLNAALDLTHNKLEKWFFGHAVTLAIYDYGCKSQVASHICYVAAMRKEPPQNARSVLADNVRTLVDFAGSQPALKAMTGVPQKTISRALHDENAASLDTLNDLARGCGLHPWQLLVPGLDLTNLPALVEHSKKMDSRSQVPMDNLHEPRATYDAKIGLRQEQRHKNIKPGSIELKATKKKHRGIG